MIRGELDWPVMKVLEKDRGRRGYESARSLGVDVRRYLDGEADGRVLPSAALYRARRVLVLRQGGAGRRVQRRRACCWAWWRSRMAGRESPAVSATRRSRPRAAAKARADELQRVTDFQGGCRQVDAAVAEESERPSARHEVARAASSWKRIGPRRCVAELASCH
ncbi:MAG: hypothetical protein U1A27_10145 [Phycisphaerae bacterium]